jgi:hypothetical protein
VYAVRARVQCVGRGFGSDPGWITSTADVVGLFLTGAAVTTSEYRHILPRRAVDFVQLKPVPTSESLLAAAVAEGSTRASSDALLALVEGLFELIGLRRFDQVDLLLKSADPALVAPEVAVGILRATSNYSHSLPNWPTFLKKTREELKKRGLQPDPILIGLGGGNDQLDQRPE